MRPPRAPSPSRHGTSAWPWPGLGGIPHNKWDGTPCLRHLVRTPAICVASLPRVSDFSFDAERSRRDCIVLCLSAHGASSPACSVFAPLPRFPALALLCAGVAAHCRAATRPNAGSRRASATLSLPGCASVAAHDGGRGPAVRGSCGGTQLLRVVQGRCVGCSAGPRRSFSGPLSYYSPVLGVQPSISRCRTPLTVLSL